MPFVFTLPKAMHIFVSVTPGSGYISPTSSVYPPGYIFIVEEITIASYDHRDQLILKEEGGDAYLLLNEIDRDIAELATIWTILYAKVRNAGAALDVIYDKLVPLLKKYIKRIP